MPWEPTAATYAFWHAAAAHAKTHRQQPLQPTGCVHARLWRNEEEWRTRPRNFTENRQLPLGALDGSRPGRILVRRDGQPDVLNQPWYVRDFVERCAPCAQLHNHHGLGQAAPAWHPAASVARGGQAAY